jgi:DNA-binding MarR family transcriptional regulator
LNEEMQRVAANLFEAASAMRRDGDVIARGVGQTQARWQVLWIAATGPHTVPALGRRLGLTRQSVQRIANALVADGLARFATNPDSARSPLFVLTDEGERTLHAINTASAKRNEQVAAIIGTEAVAQLRHLLPELTAALAVPPG